MKTERLTTELGDILKAGEIIRRGGLVAFPTETVYGLGANALDAEAVKSVYAAKGRPSDNPMIVHIADMKGLYPLVRGGAGGVPETAKKAAARIWPGPLTMIFPKSDLVPDTTTGGLDTVAVRMPSNETARRLIAASDRPIAAPSANISGRPSPTTAEDVIEDMDGRIDAVIMGEQCDVGIESTVLDLTGEVPTILRPGMITAEMLTEVLGCEVVYYKALLEKPAEIADPENGIADSGFKPKSPGMKYRHYSPKARVRLVEDTGDGFRTRVRELELAAEREGLKPAVIDYFDDERMAAHNLFADLRELDREGYDIIYIRTLEESGLGFSVMNRMLKSAGYDVVK
jgi:L-threonylcarbamoyladenylate synthase